MPAHATLGALTAAVLRELGAVDAFLDDEITRATGASDLAPVVARAADRRIDVLLREAGYDRRSFLAMVEARTSPRWVHFHLGELDDEE